MYGVNNSGINFDLIRSESFSFSLKHHFIIQQTPASPNGIGMEKDENQLDHFGINQLSQDGNSIEESKHDLKRISIISENLGNPFYEMMMEGWILE